MMGKLQFTDGGYMELETLESLISQALVIRYRIVDSGDMATKTSVENELMTIHPELDRYNAHQVMNTIEMRNLGRRHLPVEETAVTQLVMFEDGNG